MTSSSDLEARVLAAVESNAWHRGTAVVLDNGKFPMGRAADVARLVTAAHVVGDRGAADALRSAGVEVTTGAGSDLADAVDAAAEHHCLVIFCGTPRDADQALDAAITAITAADDSAVPAVAIMVLREHPAGPGPLVPIATSRFVTGYGALLSVVLAAKTGRHIRVISVEPDSMDPSHSAVLEAATRLAADNGTTVEVSTDPAPLQWVLDHDEDIAAVFHGVLEARGRRTRDGETKLARNPGDEARTAVELIERAACDVVVVLDGISLTHGTSVGAGMARAVGAALVATVALGAAAGPAAAAEEPAPISQAASPSASVDSALATSVDASVADLAARASDHPQLDPGQAATPSAADGGQVAGDQEAAGGADLSAPDAGSEPDGGSEPEGVDQDGATTQDPTTVGTPASSEGEGQSDAKGNQPIEEPTVYVGVRIYTDAQGKTQIIGTGPQDHDVAVPDLPANAREVSGVSGTATTGAAHVGGSQTSGTTGAKSSAHKSGTAKTSKSTSKSKKAPKKAKSSHKKSSAARAHAKRATKH